MARVHTRMFLLLTVFCAAVGAAQAMEPIANCTDDPGTNVLALVPVDTAVKPGEPLVVELWQLNLGQPMRGFQAFMEFDPNIVQVESVVPTATPYGLALVNTQNNAAGTIDLICGINNLGGQTPSQDDALLATITFSTSIEAAPEHVLWFRVHSPPTRFTNSTGGAVTPCAKFSGPVCIDGTPPDAEVPPDEIVECKDDIPPPELNIPCTDNCSGCEVSWKEDQPKGGSGCPGDPYVVWRIYTAVDGAGNAQDFTQILQAIDNVAPTAAPLSEVFAQCVAPAPDPGIVAAEDTCDPEPVVTHVGDEVTGTGCVDDPKTVIRTYKVCDFCGNCTYVTQTIYIVDLTKPTIVYCPPDVTMPCDDDPPPPDPTLVVATDNCAGPVTVSWVSDERSGVCPVVVTRRYRACDMCGNCSECVQKFTLVDDLPPRILYCPPDITLDCTDGGIPPCDPSLIEAEDNCNEFEVTCNDEDNGQPGCPSQERVITRTYTVTDTCGNANSCEQKITIVDRVPPVVVAPADVSVPCLDDKPDPDFAGGSVTDACDPNAGWEWEGDTDNGGSGCQDDPLIITRCYRGLDVCGNESRACQTITILDNEPPEFVEGCLPAMISVYPDAGNCAGARVKVPTPTATDNCTDSVEPVPYRSDGRALNDWFPIGCTTVFWLATDECGNVSACMQRVCVKNANLLDLIVQYEVPTACGRCVHLEFWNCSRASPVVMDLECAFAAGEMYSEAALENIEIECGAYECATAQDMLHTLRSRVEPEIVPYVDPADGTERTKYALTFADPDWLRPGNLDALINEDDEFIDILDFGVLSSQWGMPCTQWPCPSPAGATDADLNCDCVVNTADFAILYANFLEQNAPPCCPPVTLLRMPRPVMRIPVAELHQRALSHMAAGDLNHDGWLDMRDVEAFQAGKRPHTAQGPVQQAPRSRVNR